MQLHACNTNLHCNFVSHCTLSVVCASNHHKSVGPSTRGGPLRSTLPISARGHLRYLSGDLLGEVSPIAWHFCCLALVLPCIAGQIAWHSFRPDARHSSRNAKQNGLLCGVRAVCAYIPNISGSLRSFNCQKLWRSTRSAVSQWRAGWVTSTSAVSQRRAEWVSITGAIRHRRAGWQTLARGV